MYINELRRRSFWQFCLYWDRDFFESRPFLRQVAYGFQLIADGKVKSLQISMPPRAGKSYITSLFVAWWLGRNPTLTAMRNCCNARLYSKFSYDIRAMVQEAKYREVFPLIELSKDRSAIDGWSLTLSKQGAYFGAGVGGSIIGFGCHLAITDDLYPDFAAAMSTTVNEATHLWKQGAHNSRKELGCSEIYIGTRWSKLDVIGKAMSEGQIEHGVVIPALDEQDRSFCENVQSTEYYLNERDKLDQIVWEAEYMQNPIEAFGLLFPIDEIRFYPKNMEIKPDFVFYPIDPANRGGDYFAAPRCELMGSNIYVTRVICTKEGSEATNIRLEQEIKDKTLKRPDAIEYEGVFQWQQTATQLRDKVEDIIDDFRITKPTVAKETRILVQAPFIKRNIYLREDWRDYPEYRIFVNLLVTYLRDQSGINKAKNDDPPDVLAACAAYFKRNFAHLYE